MGVKDWFSTFGGKRKVETDKKHSRNITTKDSTGTVVANVALLDGVYYGTEPSLQFASPLAFTPINVPVSLVGIPTPTSDDEKTRDRLKLLIEEKADEFPVIESTKLRHGTAWRWPRYDAQNKALVWEAILDDTIEAIEFDIISGEMVAIYTHDRFTISTGRDSTEVRERYRKITRQRIEVKWVGQRGGVKSTVSDASMVNPFGHLPRPFGHDCATGEWRGHSVFGRILRVMKAYHEVRLQQVQILAEFNPKLVHSVSDVGEWMKNNGYASPEQIGADAFGSRFFLNKFSSEKTEMVYLSSDATKPHADAQKDMIRDIVSGSGVPELFWGGLATGNAASTDTQKDLAVQYIQSLQTEDDVQYQGLFNDSLEILSFVEMTNYQPCRMGWSKIDMMSEETKARVFGTASAGIASIVQSAGGSKDDVLFFWKKFYPDLPEKTIEEFSAGIKAMAEHKAYANTDALSQTDMGGE
jgi:hypothetical protein